jgi:DNA polymerase III alpha subunit
MQINNYGQVFLDVDEVFDAVYSGKITNFNNLVLPSDVTKQFNESKNINFDSFSEIKENTQINESITEFDTTNQNNWFIPETYKTFNIIDWLYEQCNTQEEKDRVSLELELFVQYKMYDLLIYLKYLIDVMRENKIVWGVGRGSSVASYVLYLIGVHKINSIKYKLDINEFLKKGE